MPEEIGLRLVTGASIKKSIGPLRSFVAEPIKFGRLFLTDDSSHTLPSTEAKGLNHAASDVHPLDILMCQHYQEGRKDALEK